MKKPSKINISLRKIRKRLPTHRLKKKRKTGAFLRAIMWGFGENRPGKRKLTLLKAQEIKKN